MTKCRNNDNENNCRIFKCHNHVLLSNMISVHLMLKFNEKFMKLKTIPLSIFPLKSTVISIFIGKLRYFSKHECA